MQQLYVSKKIKVEDYTAVNFSGIMFIIQLPTGKTKKRTDLHIQNLLKGLWIAISQKFDVVIHKHHWWFVWGHHHLWKSLEFNVVSTPPPQKTNKQTKKESPFPY